MTRRQNTVVQYIVMQPIMNLCEHSTRRPVARVFWRWWEQYRINLEGAKKMVAEAATVSGRSGSRTWTRIWTWTRIQAERRSRVEQADRVERREVGRKRELLE